MDSQVREEKFMSELSTTHNIMLWLNITVIINIELPCSNIEK